MSRTLVGKLIDLIASTLDNNGLAPLLLTQKPRYSVSVCLKKYLSAFTSNHDSVSLCRNLYKAFRWSSGLF